MLTEAQLLNHIYQTAEMGVDGIRTVLPHAESPELQASLNNQLKEYQSLQNAAGALLYTRGETPKGIGAMAKMSSEAMSAMKTMMDHSATKIAEMMIQGSTMGVTKSLRTLRDCEPSDKEVQALADKLLKTEEANIREMKRYL